MEIKTRTLRRDSWQRIIDMDFYHQTLPFDNNTAVVGVLHLKKVRKPLVVTSVNKITTIADDGYYWMQIGPKDRHWWLTLMFDPDKNIVQHYFDITLENHLDDQNSYFRDLFLDVVALPDGQVALLDEDELAEALQQGTITQDQYDLAYQTANMLLKEIPKNIDRLNALCYRLLEQLIQ